MSTLFAAKTGRREDNSYTGKVLSAVRNTLNDVKGTTSLIEVSRSLGMESMTEGQVGQLNTALETMTSRTANMVAGLGIEGISVQQQSSMVAAAIAAADLKSFAARGLSMEAIESAKGVVGNAVMSDAFANRLQIGRAHV